MRSILQPDETFSKCFGERASPTFPLPRERLFIDRSWVKHGFAGLLVPQYRLTLYTPLRTLGMSLNGANLPISNDA